MRARAAGLCLAVLTACPSEPPLPGATVVAEAGPDQRAWVGDPVTLDAAGSEHAVSFRWDLGDGERAEGAQVEHRYARPGRYAVVLEATGPDGTRITDTASVLVTYPPAEASPTSGGPLSLSPDGAAWLAIPEAAALIRVSAQGEVERLPVCAGVVAVAAGSDRVAVACPEHDRVELIDPARPNEQPVSVDFAPGSRPVNLVSIPSNTGEAGPWVVALEGSGRLAWIGLDGRVAAEVEVGGDPVGLAGLPDGSVITSRLRAIDDVSRLFRVGPSGGEVEPLELAYQPGPDTDTNTAGVPHLIAQLAISPDGRTLFAPGVLANTARGPTRSGDPLTFETTVRAQLSVVDAVGWSEALPRRKSFDDQGRALAVAVSPAGDLVWTSHPGTGVVQAIDAFNGATRRSILNAGKGITGLALTDEGDTLLVYAWLDRALHAYDVSVDPPVRRWTAELLEREPLAEEILLGKQLFWEAGDPRVGRAGYMACAHCHPDGDQDGLVWDFTARGEGVRNTLTLLGRAGTGHGPLHWSANFDEVQDFEHDLRGPNGGRGLLSDADFEATQDTLGTPKAGRSEELDALAAYVTSLATSRRSPHVSASGGEEAFADAGCDACHVPPTYTDSGSALHDVGTLTAASGQRLGGPLLGLDTPSLLGAHASPPNLHEGSAGTLREAIQAHRGTEDLDAQTLDRIVAFVRSL